MYAFKKQCVFSAVHLERKCLSLHNNITHTCLSARQLVPKNKEATKDELILEHKNYVGYQRLITVQLWKLVFYRT